MCHHYQNEYRRLNDVTTERHLTHFEYIQIEMPFHYQHVYRPYQGYITIGR
jgi:hypothetical protein